MAKKLIYISILLNYLLLATGCTTYFRTQTAETVRLPFIKNTSNECYYLDEFMPIPDGMVSGLVRLPMCMSCFDFFFVIFFRLVLSKGQWGR